MPASVLQTKPVVCGGRLSCRTSSLWIDDALDGRTYMGNERTTSVIDADGKISHIFRKIKPAEHDELVLAALAA